MSAAISDLNESLMRDALDVSTLATSSIVDLGHLFMAISETTDKESTVHGLAQVGCYLSMNWGDMTEEKSLKLKNDIEELINLNKESK